MIQLKKCVKGLIMREYWFAKKICKSDVWRIATYRNFQGVKQSLMFKHISYTLETDLQQNANIIFNSFKSNIRNEMRKAEKLNFEFRINDITIREFVAFYNDFAKSKRFKLFSEKNLDCYKKENLAFSSAYDSEKSELLVVHVYLVDGERARLLHSVSQIHNIENDEKRKLVGYFNKKLHWEDILFFKNLGYSTYDWGGYSHKVDDKVLMGINVFKKSFGGVERKVVNYNSFLFETISLLGTII